MKWFEKRRTRKQYNQNTQRFIDQHINPKRGKKDQIRIDLDNELEHMVVMLVIGCLLAGFLACLTLCDRTEPFDYYKTYGSDEYYYSK